MRGCAARILEQAIRSAPDTTAVTTTSTKPSTVKPTLERSIRREVEGDDQHWVEYTPHIFGGPLHLIGVTVNHTIGKGSDLDLRDRKGFTMTVGPAGSAPGSIPTPSSNQETLRRCPALLLGKTRCSERPHTVVRPEPCSLSRWMAISGAAFSTGIRCQYPHRHQRTAGHRERPSRLLVGIRCPDPTARHRRCATGFVPRRTSRESSSAVSPVANTDIGIFRTEDTPRIPARTN